MFMQSFVQIVPPVKEEIGYTETYVAINMKSTQACKGCSFEGWTSEFLYNFQKFIKMPKC